MARVVETIFRLKVDEQSARRSEKTIASANESMESTAKVLSKISPVAKQAAASLQQVAKDFDLDPSQVTVATANLKELDARLKLTQTELRKARAELKGLDDDAADKQRAKIAKLEKSVVSLSDTIRNIPDKLEQQARAIGSYDDLRGKAQRDFGRIGDVDTFFATSSSAVRGLGGAGGSKVADALIGVSDLAAVTEQVALITPVFQTLGKTARSVTASGNALGTVARGAQTLVPALGATGAGFVAISAAVLPIAAIAAGAAIGLNALNKQQERLKKNAEALAQAERGRAEEFANFELLVQSGDTEAIAEAYQALADDQERARLEAVRLQQTYNDVSAANAAEEATNNFAESLFDFAYSTSAEENLKAIRDDQTAAVNSQIEANARLEEAQNVLARNGIDLTQVLNDNSDAVQAFEEAEDSLATARDQYAATIANLAEQERRVREQYIQQLTEQNEDRQIAAEREQEDYEMSVAEHYDRLKDIRKQGEERIAEIQDEGSKTLAKIRADAIKQEAALLKRAGDAIAKVQLDSQAKIADLQNSYFKDSVKRERDFAKARLRAQQDLRDQIFEAELRNDIVAITLAKRKAAKDEQRATEDFNEESAERARALQERLTEIRVESQARIAEIRANLQTEQAELRAATQARIAEEKAAIQERVAAEKEAIQERIDAELEAQAKADAARELRLKRQEEDEQRLDERRRRAFEQQIAEINAKRDAELQALKAVAQVAQNLATAVGRVSEQANRILSGTGGIFGSNRPGTNRPNPNSGNAIPIGGGRGGSIRPFDTGGIVPAKESGFGYFEPNRRFDEAVIPLNRQNLAAIGGSNSNVELVINWNAPIGDGVTRGEIRQELLGLIGFLNMVDAEAIRGG